LTCPLKRAGGARPAAAGTPETGLFAQGKRRDDKPIESRSGIFGQGAYMAATGSTRSSQGLARSAIGLREVLFQPITHMAPAAAVAFSIIVGAPFAGGSLPLGVLLALVAYLFVASSIGQLAKHLPSAGGFATYASRGLHPSVEFMVAWLYALAEANVGLRACKPAARAT
jgi:Amino acid permease